MAHECESNLGFQYHHTPADQCALVFRCLLISRLIKGGFNLFVNAVDVAMPHTLRTACEEVAAASI